MVRSRTLSSTGLRTSPVSSQLCDAHITQHASLALLRVLYDKLGSGLCRHILSKVQKVYNFLKTGQLGSWKQGYVRDAHDHRVELSSEIYHKFQPKRAAYEDIRIAPSNALLDSVNNLGFCFPKSFLIMYPKL